MSSPERIAPLAASPFSNALCAIDGSPDSLSAIPEAAALLGPPATVTLLVATAFRHEGELRSPAIAPAAATEIVTRARQAARDAGVSARVVVDPSAPPIELIMRHSAGHDLLAIGAPSDTSLFGATFLNGVTTAAEEVLALPLLISRPLEEGARAGRHILVASDGLDSSDALVALATHIARAQGAETTLLHVLGHESRVRPRRIERQAEQLGGASGLPSRLRVEPGVPRQVILDAARELGASLVLMSSRRLAGLQALGSVSRPVAHLAHCPVLLMPPELLLPPQPALG